MKPSENKSAVSPLGERPIGMTGRQRLLAALRGAAVDRAPIWLREGFPILTGPATAGDFQNGWQAEPLYRELFDYVAPHADVLHNWGLANGNRFLMIPPRFVRTSVVEHSAARKRDRQTIGALTGLTEVRRGLATTWKIEPVVKTLADLRQLAAVPFDLDPAHTAQSLAGYRTTREQVGDRGLANLFLSSPIVCISGSMDLEFFLEVSLTERELIHELCAEVTRRTLVTLEALWAAGPLDTMVTFGGSEQCTPPLMSPRMFDEYVVPYDGKLIGWLKARGVPVSMHCHGRVRHALQCMVAMGADGTDPVEPPPQGDVTYAEARAIVGDRLTLLGNLEFSELEACAPSEIRQRVREVLRRGNRRLILGASAGPISAVTRRLVDNYKAWIDAALEN